LPFAVFAAHQGVLQTHAFTHVTCIATRWLLQLSSLLLLVQFRTQPSFGYLVFMHSSQHPGLDLNLECCILLIISCYFTMWS
jgi:hypothetical protein